MFFLLISQKSLHHFCIYKNKMSTSKQEKSAFFLTLTSRGSSLLSESQKPGPTGTELQKCHRQKETAPLWGVWKNCRTFTFEWLSRKWGGGGGGFWSYFLLWSVMLVYRRFYLSVCCYDDPECWATRLVGGYFSSRRDCSPPETQTPPPRSTDWHLYWVLPHRPAQSMGEDRKPVFAHFRQVCPSQNGGQTCAGIVDGSICRIPFGPRWWKEPPRAYKTVQTSAIFRPEDPECTSLPPPRPPLAPSPVLTPN